FRPARRGPLCHHDRDLFRFSGPGPVPENPVPWRCMGVRAQPYPEPVRRLVLYTVPAASAWPLPAIDRCRSARCGMDLAARHGAIADRGVLRLLFGTAPAAAGAYPGICSRFRAVWIVQ